MISLESRALCGEVETRLYGKNGLIRSFRKSKNMTVTKGFQMVCDMMGKSTGQPVGFRYCAVGSNNTAPALGNTLLGGELARTIGAYTRTADTVWTNEATFTAGVGTGTIVESGLFNIVTANAQTMLCRQTFGAITKGASDTLVVTWQYTLS